MQEICRRSAGDLQEICRRSAGDLQEICRRYAEDLQEICRITVGDLYLFYFVIRFFDILEIEFRSDSSALHN
jgi:hypothetical protein